MTGITAELENRTSQFAAGTVVAGGRWCRQRFAKLISVLLLATFVVSAATVHQFLAVSAPQGQGVLVVEAWIPEDAISESAKVFNAGPYRYLVLVGAPMRGSDAQFGRFTNYADRAASRLERNGFDSTKLVAIKVPSQPTRRTFAMATAVRDWLRTSAVSIRTVDVFTTGVHARKSWILFQHALGKDYSVGVISGRETSYDPSAWWISRRGLWLVTRNLAGYAYSRLWIYADKLCATTGSRVSTEWRVRSVGWC
jgi:hypothetical protein